MIIYCRFTNKKNNCVLLHSRFTTELLENGFNDQIPVIQIETEGFSDIYNITEALTLYHSAPGRTRTTEQPYHLTTFSVKENRPRWSR